MSKEQTATLLNEFRLFKSGAGITDARAQGIYVEWIKHKTILENEFEWRSSKAEYESQKKFLEKIGEFINSSEDLVERLKATITFTEVSMEKINSICQYKFNSDLLRLSLELIEKLEELGIDTTEYEKRLIN